MEKKRLQGARGESGPRRGESAFESFGDPGACARPKPSPRGLLCSSARSPDPGPAKSPAGGSVSPDSPRQQRWHRGPPLPPTSATELTPRENKTKNDPPIPPLYPSTVRVSSPQGSCSWPRGPCRRFSGFVVPSGATGKPAC